MTDALRLARAEARALAARLQHEKDAANIDYIAMMTDVEIPTEEERDEDEPLTEV